jgi:hypothetical protein
MVAPALPDAGRSGECEETEMLEEEELRTAWSRASILRMAAAERAALRSARRFARAVVAPALPDAGRSGEGEETEMRQMPRG